MSTVTGTLGGDGARARPNALVRLYRGETSYDFVGRRRVWFAISGVIILAGLLSLGFRGLNLGIDFKGGTSWEVAANGASVASVTNAVNRAGLSGPIVQILGHGSSAHVQVQADLSHESNAQQVATKASVEQVLGRIGHVPAGQVSVTDVGPTWGGEITHKAILAVIVFLIVVVVYISLRFEWKMAIAALLAVVHDLLVVVGIYSLLGAEVASSTVIAVLTILGYSLYDTVVVFDRVADNTKGLGASGRMTYEDVVNLSMNQTLARSINTSLVAILPVLSVLLIGAQLLGDTSLQYFGLALVIGLTSGAYSSIFIASPVLAMMKERETRYATIREKLQNRADRTGLLTPRAAALLTATAGGGGTRPSASGRTKTQVRGRTAAPQRKAPVLRPGAAGSKRQAVTATQAVSTQTAEQIEEIEEEVSDGAGDGRAARARPSAPTARAGTSGAQVHRPAPRPRKSKGSRKGRRR